METFTREADTKAAEAASVIESRARQGVPDDKKSSPSGTKEKAVRSSRDNGRISQKPAHHKRSSNAKLAIRDANG